MNHVDSDFNFQGEYEGSIAIPGGSWQDVGMQVVARGGGKFDATFFSAGLPGNGKTPNARYELSGKKEDDILVLNSDQFMICVEPAYALVYTAIGNPIGQIQKVHRVSPTMGAYPPINSEVIFNGKNTSQFEDGKMTYDGTLKQGTQLKKLYSNFTIHMEFKTPYMPYELEQKRGNSGLYILSRYEVQILDSFGLVPKYNHCGSLYKTKSPDINMCLPPLSWQTYDIVFKSPEFDEAGNKTVDANITVWQNGVCIHRNVSIPNKTGAGKQEEPFPLPIRFQDHHDPVRFRNIWIIDQSMPMEEITELARRN